MRKSISSYIPDQYQAPNVVFPITDPVLTPTDISILLSILSSLPPSTTCMLCTSVSMFTVELCPP